jgi:hypothetical protein
MLNKSAVLLLSSSTNHIRENNSCTMLNNAYLQRKLKTKPSSRRHYGAVISARPASTVLTSVNLRPAVTLVKLASSTIMLQRVKTNSDWQPSLTTKNSCVSRAIR